jgi:predicted RNase H-like nuclease (RuvC/YqgF family)
MLKSPWESVICDATLEITAESQTGGNLIEILPVIIGALLVATVVASIGYYRQIRRAQKEYEKAKETVEYIVLSFNRELKRESDRLETIAFRLEGSSAKAETGLKKADNIEKKITPLETQIENISQNNNNLLSGISGLETKIKNIEL